MGYLGYDPTVGELSYATGKRHYILGLKGRNAELGTTWKAYAKKQGADVQVEYGPKPGWEESSAKARITVTAQNGRTRTYYVIYRQDKATASHIKGIKGKAGNELWKAVCDGGLNIMGSTPELDENNLEIALDDGYTADFSPKDPTSTDPYEKDKIIVTETATGNNVSYPVSYNTDDFSIQAVKSGGKYLSSSIASYQDTNYTTQEKYYKISLTGDASSCPMDLEAVVPDGTEAAVTYKTDENWPYQAIGTGTFDAKIEVSKNGRKKIYLVSYTQDTSGAEIGTVRIEGGVSQGILGITDSNDRYYWSTEKSGSVLLISGKEKAMDRNFKVYPNNGGEVINRIYKGDPGWQYADQYIISGGWYMSGIDDWMDHVYKYEACFTIRAKNGVEKTYIVAYEQDTRDAQVKGIANADKTYLSHRIQGTEPIEISTDDGTSSEFVQLIYVKGNKPELGRDFTLETSKDAAVTTIYKGEPGWQYTEECKLDEYYDRTLGQQIYGAFSYTARITVKSAKNGAERIYLIAYSPDDSGAAVSAVHDAGNTYASTNISPYPDLMAVRTADGRTSSETVYEIGIVGRNPALGTDFALTLPEGCSEVGRVYKGETGWNYTEASENACARVTVQAAGGVQRIYLISYVQSGR